MEGAVGRMVVRKDFGMGDQDLLDAANRQRTVPVDYPLIEVARAVKTNFGDPVKDRVAGASAAVASKA